MEGYRQIEGKNAAKAIK